MSANLLNHKFSKSIGVLTSGGDSQGMNSAIRAVVRTGLFMGCKVFFIKEGYQGMIDGGDSISEAKWDAVSSKLHWGGTFIGSSRCPQFLTREGRVKAAKNLVRHKIGNLVVIGGDGSLTGADKFKNEWETIMNELLSSGEISQDDHKNSMRLNVVGIVGSIDNDFCGTDITLGTNTAIHRIIEAIDSIASTAFSHKRVFILEVMGRHCGYLALASAIASEADFLFVPEDPVPVDWRVILCEKLKHQRSRGERVSIVIIAEGAMDVDGNQISSEMVKKAVIEKLKSDTRVTVLGHVQRGGMPSAYDQILGARMGSEAVFQLLTDEMSDEDPQAKVIVLKGNRAIAIPLLESVTQTQSLTSVILKETKTSILDLAIKMRGLSFERNLKIFKRTLDMRDSLDDLYDENSLNFAIMHVGEPSCGMNAAVHAFVRSVLYYKDRVYGIEDGFEGLIEGKFKQLSWLEMNAWVMQGSANLRTNDTLPDGKFKEIAEMLRKFKIHGLVVVGGFEAYLAFGQLSDQRENFPEFCIPLCVIPACVCNNIPGTEFSIGTDTCLNEIVKACNAIRQAGAGLVRAYVIEVMGEFCGYLATLAAIASGADSVYIPEKPTTLEMLINDLNLMKSKVNDNVKRGLFIRNEKSSENFDSDFIRRLFAEEGQEVFSACKNTFGDWQLGAVPSPYDRMLGVKMGNIAGDWMLKTTKMTMDVNGNVGHSKSDNSACLLALNKNGYEFIPLKNLIDETDFVKKRPKNQWWINLANLVKILALHPSEYKNSNSFEYLRNYLSDSVR